jgi:L-lactate dehydrogenase complex protein LldE
MRIALFITCVNDLMFPATGRAVVTILERLGHRVDFPPDQTCCGQMHANSGHRPGALALARRFTETFAAYDAVVAPSGSCVAMVRDAYPRLWPGAAAVAARTHELSELLVDILGVTDVGGWFPHRVTYHPSCHGLRTLRLGDRPQRLLRDVRAIDLVDLGDAAECCGFGGTFALNNAGVSAAMLADKCTAVTSTGAEYVAATDNSCLMHIGGGLSRAGSTTRALHYAEILAHQGPVR